ncbi:unnamed protein product [Spirodela intermedia]|uniref:Aminotransferase class I/classII large domain-containing protein n=1 Tax=Spirodela intermedia TaxID=51605 RepID=A0A7I8JG57_SPIIN|nr:unnamed protein product [Spirodela intermedia]CAA6669137.1 unnamed protein product [Spirodela intermedia]
MEGMLSKLARTLKPSPIQELSHLAQRCGAINLAEGFPDFPAPAEIKNAAISAIDSDFNQYRHVQGICDKLSKIMKQNHGLDFDPLTDIAICCGQTEAFAAAVFATISPGDEVLLFDPCYETYETSIAMAGGIPNKSSSCEQVTSLFINSFYFVYNPYISFPHNPTGKVFSTEELEAIAKACCTMDCVAITDEVYEFITFERKKHSSIASFPGMQERTIITSSLSKTFSVTGWRIGWAMAPAVFASAIRNIHIKLTDSAPAPFQEAALTALSSPPQYFESLRKDYEARRDHSIQMLVAFGFGVQFRPQGSFFVFAELPEDWISSDVEFVEALIKKAGIAAVPGCGFFHTPSDGQQHQRRYVRFAFCKSMATLTAAAERMSELVGITDDIIFRK